MFCLFFLSSKCVTIHKLGYFSLCLLTLVTFLSAFICFLPQFGDLSDSHFFRTVEGSKEDLLTMWGEAPITHSDIYEVFAQYVEGKIPILPWCESALAQETVPLTRKLAAVNRAGFLSINSQPAVNGAKSTHPMYGWGGEGGRVYQKAYIEFFASPELMKAIVQVLHRHPNLNFNAINSEKVEISSGHKSVTGTCTLSCIVSIDSVMWPKSLTFIIVSAYLPFPTFLRNKILSYLFYLVIFFFFHLQRWPGVCSPTERSCSPRCSIMIASSSGARRYVFVCLFFCPCHLFLSYVEDLLLIWPLFLRLFSRISKLPFITSLISSFFALYFSSCRCFSCGPSPGRLCMTMKPRVPHCFMR